MSRREFLQLADHYDPRKHDVAGWFISEKLDGQRCFWDGGITRGLPTEEVAWASIIDPKTGQKKAKIKPVATGLWSRYGNPIMAPDWWLNRLPACPLDGELWAGRGKFQLCRSICGGDTADERFAKIVFAVYSTPPLGAVFSTGQIKNANMVCNVDYLTVEAWIRQRLNSRGKRFDGVPVPKRCLGDDFKFLAADQPFGKEVVVLNEALENIDGSVCYLHPQTKLIDVPEAAGDQVEEYLQRVLDQGGEGVVIRNPEGVWTPKRHRNILKYKPHQDCEVHITGFTSGRETNKGSRLLGKIGALICDCRGQRLEVAGLTDAEREFETAEMSAWASKNPGVDMPNYFGGKCFRVGQTITIKYRELTDAGLPKEVDFVKTSTGFGPGGATPEAVKVMRRTIEELGSRVQIKASGGIKTYADACRYLCLGCKRIGASVYWELLP